MYKVVYTAEARHQILNLDNRIQSQIKHAIERVASDPGAGKKLTGQLSEFYSYASGNYRVIYKVSHHEILVIIMTAGHRKDVYKKLSRKFKRRI